MIAAHPDLPSDPGGQGPRPFPHPGSVNLSASVHVIVRMPESGFSLQVGEPIARASEFI